MVDIYVVDPGSGDLDQSFAGLGLRRFYIFVYQDLSSASIIDHDCFHKILPKRTCYWNRADYPVNCRQIRLQRSRVALVHRPATGIRMIRSVSSSLKRLRMRASSPEYLTAEQQDAHTALTARSVSSGVIGCLLK